MSGRLVVKRYARALLEAAGERGEQDQVREDMDFIDNLMKEAPEIRRFCLESEGRGRKESIFVETAFLPYVSPVTGRAMNLLRENGRLAAIPFLPEAYTEQEDLDAGRIALLIESAGDLPSQVTESLTIKMKERTGRDCRTEIRVDKSLLGGFRITWENRMIDMSLKGRLKKMRRMLRG